MEQQAEDDSEETIDLQPTVVEVKKRERPPLTLTCLVCSAPAPEHLHFGAHCCYSCRAFFRRTTQRKQSNYKLRCRSGKKNCSITNKKGDGRNCIFCRYEKCIGVGMVPEKLKGKRSKAVTQDASINDNFEEFLNEEDNVPLIFDDNQVVHESGSEISTERNLVGVELTVDDTITYHTLSEESSKPQAVISQFSQPSGTQNGQMIQSQNGYEMSECSTSQLSLFDYHNYSPNLAPSNMSNATTYSTYSIPHGTGFQPTQTQSCAGQSNFSFHNTPTVPREIHFGAAYFCQHPTVTRNPYQNNTGPGPTDSHFSSPPQQPNMTVIVNDPLSPTPLLHTRNLVDDLSKCQSRTIYESSQTYYTIENYANNHCSFGAEQESQGSEISENPKNDVKSSRAMLEADHLLNKSPVSLVKVEKTKTKEVPIRVSVIRGPMNTNLDLGFSTEESKCILNLKSTHATNHKSLFQAELFEARVRCHFGTSPMDELLLIVSGGRKIQNNYHYLTMFTIPFFSQLSNRSQNFLMKKNSTLCFSLNMAHFYFGHTAQTAIDQERLTGLDTGLGDYIRTQASAAAGMGAAVYENHFIAPWATSREHEAIHKKASMIIGETTKELDVCAYLLLYGIALYNIQDNLLSILNIPEQEVSMIKKAQNYLSLLYSRYCQHLVGPVRSSEPRMNQHFILAQLEKCELVYSRENLHLDDLSDSKGLDVQAVGEDNL